MESSLHGRIPTRMQAVVLTGPGEVTLQDVPIPAPGPMDVLCRVDSVYICGTDPHIIRGDYPGFWPRSYPFTPGHEWAGTIVGVGEGAAKFGWTVGTRVAGTSHTGCGYCRMCVTGRYNLCENYGRDDLGHRQYGHYTAGAYAEYVVHSVRSVFRIPPTLSLEEAAAMDPASIALHTVKRGEMDPGDTIVVLGPGPMGQLVIQCAFALGAGLVIAVGHGDRLAKAAELGAETVDYTGVDPVEAVRDRTGGQGAPVVVDAAGTARSLGQAVQMVHKGGRVSVIGIPLEPVMLPAQRLVLDEIEVRGVRANRGTCAEVLPLMASGKISIRPLHTHTFSLSQFPEALETFTQRKGGAIKVLIKPGRD